MYTWTFQTILRCAGACSGDESATFSIFFFSGSKGCDIPPRLDLPVLAARWQSQALAWAWACSGLCLLLAGSNQPSEGLAFFKFVLSHSLWSTFGLVSRYCCSFAILVLRFSALKVTALFTVWFSRSSLRRLLTCCLERTWIGVLICGFVQGLMGFGFLQ